MMVDAKALLDGKRTKMQPGNSKCEQGMFCCFSCGFSLTDTVCGISEFSFLNTFAEKDGVMTWTNSDAKAKCLGVTICCPSSIPCPIVGCCAPAGTPCALVFHWVQDKEDPTKWIATGGVCEKQCCLAMSNHDGDYVIVNAERDGSKEKPLHMFGGKNPQTPPCFMGKEVFNITVIPSKGGAAPDAATMER